MCFGSEVCGEVAVSCGIDVSEVVAAAMPGGKTKWLHCGVDCGGELSAAGRVRSIRRPCRLIGLGGLFRRDGLCWGGLVRRRDSFRGWQIVRFRCRWLHFLVRA